MARARVNLNSRGMSDLLHDSGVRDELTDRMERVLSAAQSSAPILTGGYRDSLHIEQDTTDRVAVRVVSDLPYALVVEANTGNLARSLDSAS